MGEAFELLLGEVGLPCDVYSLDALGGCGMGFQQQQWPGGMLDGAFYERGGVGACALGQNSYLSPLKVSLVNESSTGEGFLAAKQSQVPVSSFPMNQPFLSHGEKKGRKRTASPTLTWFDDLQGSRLESQDDFLNYEKPQVLNQPSNSVVFEHSNHSAIIVNDAEPILDRDCRIPSSSELLYSSAAAKVKNNQPAKDIALRSNEKHNQQQRELLTNQEVKRLKRTKDEKGKSCEKIIDYYQYMADSETEDELTQTTHIAFSPCSNGQEQPSYLRTSLMKSACDQKVNNREGNFLKWVFGVHIPKKWVDTKTLDTSLNPNPTMSPK